MREFLSSRYVSGRYVIMFSVSVSMLENYYAAKTGNRRTPRFKVDSDMDSENLSSLIRLSVSDGQKTDSSNVVLFIGI